MHKDSSNFSVQRTNQSGNVLIYILIALALFGFLTLTIARMNVQNDNRNLNNERVELFKNELIEFVASAGQTVDMMTTTGVRIDEINLVKPDEAGYDEPTANLNIRKLFHSEGGGLNYQSEPNENMMRPIDGDSGWHYQNEINVEWTPSAEPELILTANQINRAICERLNESITGSTEIPVISGTIREHFVEEGGNVDFTIADCPECESYNSLCVANNSETAFAFYNILAQQ
ncbi:MAG: hypothetical protein AAF549_02840 [Pseudomonadota bacterium]